MRRAMRGLIRAALIRQPPRLDRMARSFVTKVHQSREGSPSLRSAIPETVATILNVKRGDSIVWTVEPEIRRVTVSKRTVGFRQ